MKHYELTQELEHLWGGSLVYRIRATKDVPNMGVKKGDLGGWVSMSATLGEDCWVFDEAVLGRDASLLDASRLKNKARVLDNAVVGGGSTVEDNACVLNNAVVDGGSTVRGDSRVCGSAQVLNHSIMSSNIVVKDDAVVDGSRLGGYSLVMDNAWVCNAVLTGCCFSRDEVFVGKGS